MITARIEGNLYEIEFQHAGKDAPKHARHTLCTITILALRADCPRHIAQFEQKAGVARECTCAHIATAVGTARCNPIDGFTRETGRKIALDRALREVEPKKTFRRICWNAYFDRANSQVSKSAR